MKRITIVTILVLCALLSGCAPGRREPVASTTVPTRVILDIETEATLNTADDSKPLPTLEIAIDPIPQSTDDSDYQLPPGEHPTVPPEIK